MKIDDTLIERYLDRVMLVADYKGSEADDLRQELADHLYAKTAALIKEGASLEVAIMTTLQESGKPLAIGYRLRKPWRWVDVRAVGTAKGFIAVGPKAIGVFAFGGWTLGLVSFGGISMGLLSIGGVALGGLVFGGIGLGGYVLAGMGVGAIAYGGASVGLLAGGTATLGWLGDFSERLPQILQRGKNPALSNLFIYLMAVYAVLLVSLSCIQLREAKRIKPGDDESWLWE